MAQLGVPNFMGHFPWPFGTSEAGVLKLAHGQVHAVGPRLKRVFFNSKATKLLQPLESPAELP